MLRWASGSCMNERADVLAEHDRPDAREAASARGADIASSQPKRHMDHVPLHGACHDFVFHRLGVDQMASRHLSGRRSGVLALDRVARRLCRGHAADDRVLGLRHTATVGSLCPRLVAGDLANSVRPCVHAHAARRRGFDQFLGAAVRRFGIDPLAEGAPRSHAGQLS